MGQIGAGAKARNSFYRDLRLGECGEDIIINILKESGIPACSSRQRSHDINLEYKYKLLKGEVKYDVMAQRTSNIAIEFSNMKGEPTGLYNTPADLWFHIISPGEIYACGVNQLKQFISDKPGRAVYGAGDGANIYLYKICDLHVFSPFNKINCIFTLESLWPHLQL